MRVKICGITNIEDALASVELGTDAIGLRIRPKLSVNNARLIVSSLPPLVTPVLLIYRPDDSTVDNIYALCNKIGVFTVQIYREISELSVDMLRRMISGIKIIKAIPVITGETVVKIAEYEKYVDAFLLDSIDPRTRQVGGTGLQHDWNQSSKIVQASKVPVILAGGLNHLNVRSAIETVRPWGVDCETGVEKSDGIKDYEKLKKFILISKTT